MPGSMRLYRGVDGAKKCHPGIGSGKQRLDQFEIAYRHCVEYQAVLPFVKADAVYVIEGSTLG